MPKSVYAILIQRDFCLLVTNLIYQIKKNFQTMFFPRHEMHEK